MEKDNFNPLYASVFPEKTSKGDKKKMEIVEAALVLSTRMALDFTYDDIAKMLSTTRSHVTYHFPERTDLVMAMIRLMMASGLNFTFERMREAKTPAEQMRKYLDGYFDFFLVEPRFIPTMLYFYYASGVPGSLRELQTQVRAAGRSRIEELMRLAVEGEQKHVPRNLTQLASAVQFMVVGGLMLNISTGEAINAGRTQETKVNVLRAIEKMLKVKLLEEA